LLRTADAVTPFLTARAAATSLVLFGAIYTFIFSFGTYYIYQLLRAGPAGRPDEAPSGARPGRPMSLADGEPENLRGYVGAGE
jgi:cytochrome d ubiquinol oxidase subunit I